MYAHRTGQKQVRYWAHPELDVRTETRVINFYEDTRFPFYVSAVWHPLSFAFFSPQELSLTKCYSFPFRLLSFTHGCVPWKWMRRALARSSACWSAVCITQENLLGGGLIICWPEPYMGFPYTVYTPYMTVYTPYFCVYRIWGEMDSLRNIHRRVNLQLLKSWVRMTQSLYQKRMLRELGPLQAKKTKKGFFQCKREFKLS